MWELRLDGRLRAGLEDRVADTTLLKALAVTLCDSVGPGQSEYYPAVASTDGGVSLVCEHPGGGVSIDTYTWGTVSITVKSSDYFDQAPTIVRCLQALPLQRYRLRWSHSS